MLPGGAETKHLINEKVLRKLGPNGFFINVGRGSSVDELALARALAEGQIAGAGLDVYENEPMVPDALLAQSNLVLLPHIGSATDQTRNAMGQLVIDNLEAYFANATLKTEYFYR
jgi:hydroxypyruvate reductase